MPDMQLLLQIGQIVVAALIVVVPPFYPRNSLFTNRAQNASQSLVEGLNFESDFDVHSIDQGEKGFRQLFESVQDHHSVDGEVSAIAVAWGSSRTELWNHVDMHVGSAVVPNTVIYLEYEDDTRQAIVSHPFDRNMTLNLIEINDWIRNRSIQRSNYITAILALFWTTISIILII